MNAYLAKRDENAIHELDTEPCDDNKSGVTNFNLPEMPKRDKLATNKTEIIRFNAKPVKTFTQDQIE
jgi:hypothetical protein